MFLRHRRIGSKNNRGEKEDKETAHWEPLYYGQAAGFFISNMVTS
jgi:hypothetical protein